MNSKIFAEGCVWLIVITLAVKTLANQKPNPKHNKWNFWQTEEYKNLSLFFPWDGNENPGAVVMHVKRFYLKDGTDSFMHENNQNHTNIARIQNAVLISRCDPDFTLILLKMVQIFIISFCKTHFRPCTDLPLFGENITNTGMH